MIVQTKLKGVIKHATANLLPLSKSMNNDDSQILI